jgi:hypothetical protein
LTDKKLRQYTNEDIWQLLAAKDPKVIDVPAGEGAVATPSHWIYSLTNGVIMIDLLGGDTYSQPDTLDRLPQNYDKITIKLWDYREATQEELDLCKNDTPLHYKIPGTDQEFFINIQWNLFPHTGINPMDDDRFKHMPWASDFKYHTMTAEALLPPALCCDIIRFCDQISGLKAFW